MVGPERAARHLIEQGEQYAFSLDEVESGPRRRGHGVGQPRRRAGRRHRAAAPAFTSIGPLTFGADAVLFAADVQSAAIYAVDLGAAATGGAPGTKAIAAVDQQIAALLGTDVREISVTDLAVHPKTRNAFISVMRGQGADAKPVLLRADGAGKITIVDLSKLKATKVDLPNAPARQRRRPRRGARAVDHRHGLHGRPAVCRRSVERRVLVEAALAVVSVHDGRRRHERRDLPRQPRPVRDAVAGLHVRAVQGGQSASPDCRLPVHAAGEVPGGEPQAGRRRFSARRSPSSATATARST